MKPKKIPQRSCLGCNLKTDKNKLIRVVRKPDGEVVIDKTGKVAGRGAYICSSRECLKEAIKRKSLERALNIKLSDDLIVELNNQIIND